MTRHPDTYEGAGTPVFGDVHDAGQPRRRRSRLPGGLLPGALAGLQGLRAARRRGGAGLRAAAADAGVEQIIYLGGLGSDADDLSAHLRSRREVESLLGAAGVPVTVLRAGIIIGNGGISWEITRQLVDHLPAMVTPRWVAPGPSRSPSTTWSATSSACSAGPRRSARSSRSAARRCWRTPR